MTRLTTEEVGSIFANLEAVVNSQLLGHEKLGTITLHTSCLSYHPKLIEATGFITSAFAFVTDSLDSDTRWRIRITLGYLQRFLDDKSLVDELNRIKTKLNLGEKCTDTEKTTYLNFKNLVNERMDTFEAVYTKISTILINSKPRDNNLPKKIAALFDIEYIAPKPSVLGIAKFLFFGR